MFNEDFINDIVDKTIWNKTVVSICHKEEVPKVIQFATTEALRVVEAVLAMQNISHESSPVFTTPESKSAPPPPLDRHAAGSIKVKDASKASSSLLRYKNKSHHSAAVMFESPNHDTTSTVIRRNGRATRSNHSGRTATRSRAGNNNHNPNNNTPVTLTLKEQQALLLTHIPETPEDLETKAWRNTCLSILRKGNSSSQKRWRKLAPETVQAVATPELAEAHRIAAALEQLDIVPSPSKNSLNTTTSSSSTIMVSEFTIAEAGGGKAGAGAARKNKNAMKKGNKRAQTAPEPSTRSLKPIEFFRQSNAALGLSETPYVPVVDSKNAASNNTSALNVSHGVTWKAGDVQKLGGKLGPVKNKKSREEFLSTLGATGGAVKKRPMTTPVLRKPTPRDISTPPAIVEPIKDPPKPLVQQNNFTGKNPHRGFVSSKPGSPTSRRAKTPVLQPIKKKLSSRFKSSEFSDFREENTQESSIIRPDTSKGRRRLLKSRKGSRYQREFKTPSSGKIFVAANDDDLGAADDDGGNNAWN